MSDPETATVWRASRLQRAFSYTALVLLSLMAIKVALSYGYLATIGILLILAAAGQVYWAVLRPRLTAGPDGVDVLLGRQPVHLNWGEIRGCEVGPRGLRILCVDGREVVSRFPRPGTAAAGGEPTEADRAVAFLTQRAAWAKKTGGKPPPRYQPPASAKP